MVSIKKDARELRRDTHASLELNRLDGTITALVVQLRLPVVAVIKDLIASGGASGPGLIIGQGELEIGATENSVHMGGDSARINDGIATLLGQGSAVDSEDLSLNSRGQGREEDGTLCEDGRHDELASRCKLDWTLRCDCLRLTRDEELRSS